MKLENIAFSTRPRLTWEAVDLGFQMARRWWRPLMMAWLAVFVPLALLLCALPISADYFSLLLWWLKPLFERPLLYILSHAVFGEVPSLRQTLRATPGLWGRQWFLSLTWRRLSASRSFDLPLVQLEGLKGQARKHRLRVLHRDHFGPAVWITLIGAHLEVFIALSLVILVASFAPATEGVEWFENMRENDWLGTLFYMVAMSLVAPFYVAAGFAIYLNRRVHLEGWDIELAFRRLVARVKPAAAMIFLALMTGMFFAMPTTTWAEQAAPSSATEAGGAIENVVETPVEVAAPESEIERTRKQINDILHSDELEEHKLTRYPKFLENWNWKPGAPDAQKASPSRWIKVISWLSKSLELLAWIAVVVLILILLFRYRHWLAAAVGKGRPGKTATPIPQTLFGLDVTAESLPSDVAAAAQQLWQLGRHRDAIGLLYRAFLSCLIHRCQLVVLSGYTEGDCLRMLKRQGPENFYDFGRELTVSWQALAYAHRVPTQDQFNGLCEQWRHLIRADAEEVA